jgi:hypothetical protein
MKSQPAVSPKTGALPPQTTFRCPSCGTENSGGYCGNCGEKEINESDYSLQHYAKEVTTEFTSLESKLFRSIWLLLTKPGFLSSEYFRGRRVQYMKPLQLFVFLNVVYYFSLTLFVATTFTTPLATQLRMNDYYSGYAQRRVDQKLLREQTSYQDFEQKYNERTSVLSKTLIFLLIPVFAFLFFLLFFRKRKYFVEHVVVATHFWSFNLILLGVILPAISVLLIRLLGGFHVSSAIVTSDGPATVALQICIGLYLFAMLRRFYVASRWCCALSATVIAWSFFHLVWFYRFCLFELTLRSV